MNATIETTATHTVITNDKQKYMVITGALTMAETKVGYPGWWPVKTGESIECEKFAAVHRKVNRNAR